MTARERIVEIRRAAITKFNAEYRAKLIAEGRSPEYIKIRMEGIEEANELSDLFWSHSLIEYLDEKKL